MKQIDPLEKNREKYFREQLDQMCQKMIGMGYDELPDLVCICDFYTPNKSDRDIRRMAHECAEEIKEQLEREYGLL